MFSDWGGASKEQGGHVHHGPALADSYNMLGSDRYWYCIIRIPLVGESLAEGSKPQGQTQDNICLFISILDNYFGVAPSKDHGIGDCQVPVLRYACTYLGSDRCWHGKVGIPQVDDYFAEGSNPQGETLVVKVPHINLSDAYGTEGSRKRPNTCWAQGFPFRISRCDRWE